MKTASISFRVEPETKQQADKILNELGVPMASALNMFLKQVVSTRSIPLEIKLPDKAERPKAFDEMTYDDLKQMLDEANDDIANGRVHSMEDVHRDIQEYMKKW